MKRVIVKGDLVLSFDGEQWHEDSLSARRAGSADEYERWKDHMAQTYNWEPPQS